tara:strand:+ start:1628 stop:2224 length:597 start_codon:yes stop_codon:yes gene_type:complete
LSNELFGSNFSAIMKTLNQREIELLHHLFSPEVIADVLERHPELSTEDLDALYNKLFLQKSGVSLILYVDGAADLKAETAGIGGIFYLDGGDVEGELFSFSKNIGKATNNEAEYGALIEGLKIGKELNGSQIQVFSDSELMVKQINLEYKVKNERIRKLYDTVTKQLAEYDDWKVKHVGREQNKKADILSKQGLDEGR